MNQKDAIARAKEFDHWWERKGLKEALGSVREGYIDQLTTKPVDNIPALQAYRIAIRVTDIVESHIRSVMANGKIAERELRQIEKSTKRKVKL